MSASSLPKYARALLAAAIALPLTSAAVLNSASAQTAKPPLTGFWQAYFDDGNPSGWFYFSEKNGFFEGRLVKMYKKKGETTLVTSCPACPGDKKNKPMLGMVIVYNLKHDGAKYENGNILDPRDGNVYNAEAEITPDGQKLLLRGYLGFELLGQTQTWTRLPDDTMALADIPGEPVGPKPAKPAGTAKPAPAKPAPAKPAPAAAQPHGDAPPDETKANEQQ